MDRWELVVGVFLDIYRLVNKDYIVLKKKD